MQGDGEQNLRGGTWPRFERVLQRELDWVERRRDVVRAYEDDTAPPPEPPEEGDRRNEKTWDRARDLGLFGLAFSGGGIRSATFNLGILQALADKRILRRIDYLSTVSGGGYIGGWLTALIQRERDADRADPPAAAGGTVKPDVVGVEERLAATGDAAAGARRPPRECPEDSAITYLRRYSNYLTPRIGMLTADTWSAVATYLRNLLLNLVLLLSFIGLILLVPRLVDLFVTEGTGLPSGLTVGVLVSISALAALRAVLTLAGNMALFKAGRPGGRKPDGQRRLILYFLIPMGIATVIASVWLPLATRQDVEFPLVNLPAMIKDLRDPLEWGVWVAVLGALVFSLAAIRAMLDDRKVDEEPAKKGPGDGANATGSDGNATPGDDLSPPPPDPAGSKSAKTMGAAWVITAVASGLIAGPILWALCSWLATMQSTLVQLTVGPPLLLIWLLILEVLQIGLLGNAIGDDQREWLSRLGGWLLITALGWLVLFGITLAGPVLLAAAGGYLKTALVSGWLITTLGGVFASRTVKEADGGVNLLKRALVALAPYVFIAGLVAAVAMGLNRGIAQTAEFVEHRTVVPTAVAHYERTKAAYHAVLLEREEGAVAGATEARDLHLPVGSWRVGAPPVEKSFGGLWRSYLRVLDESQTWRAVLLWALVLGLVVLVLQWRLDINEFSMHRFYGNRLARCYLGASVEPAQRKETRQPFTGFAKDDLELASVRNTGPYHLVNTALNLVAGRELAWQERKAASFVLAPLYSGFCFADGDGDSNDCYRATERFANQPHSLTLGDAMTTSGAAASPNMGFRTSTAFAFLMTVLNVRLGRWIGNPRNARGWVWSSPRLGLKYLVLELFGLTSLNRRFVYLSDGGHFDNLGLYELVRRRCRFIIACDGGADPDYNFEDLGNAIRKVRNDFGVDIRIDVGEIRDRPDGRMTARHCAIGKIVYPEDEGGDPGTLLYIKSSITGDEPEDVLNYAAENPSFPHQTTGDQFFGESQFESYRRLGQHVGTEVFEELPTRATIEDHLNVENLFLRLDYRWHPRALADSGSFARHADALDRMFERLRENPRLRFLDEQFYPEWRVVDTGTSSSRLGMLAVPYEEAVFRDGFYFCNSLIQLMENVYLDLKLEHEWEHPDNRGWVNLFKHWSWSGMFKVTWAISAATYGIRFQLFCERHLDLTLGVVTAECVIPTLVGADEAALSEALAQSTTLNFYEREQIVPAVGRLERPEVWKLNLRVPQALRADGQPFVFNFGYCLLDGDEIIYFRVQDHLRKCGLGRRGLEQLFKACGPRAGSLRLAALERRQAALAMGDRTDETEASFRRLLASVQRQGDYAEEG